MRLLLSIFLACCTISGFSNPTAYQKLCEVNRYWEKQSDIDKITLAPGLQLSEKEWIRFHLSQVEQVLRNRNANHLTATQKQNRAISLDNLHEYWLVGNFPLNEDYSYRTPIFIDKHDNFCAVGYLVKASGHEDISRSISAKTNLAYVQEMDHPELLAWASEYGFTVDELAWIQPGYPPYQYAAPIGKGTDSVVHELYSDNAGGKLYVGGIFTKVDETINAKNIAYITENNGDFTWHNMGNGVNGPVYAITGFDNKVFVGGDFTVAGNATAFSVASWDGNEWSGVGASCLKGVVKDLIVYHGKLYAAGNLTVYPGVQTCLAQWMGTCWSAYPGLNGTVNTMEVFNDKLVLGGNFSYNGNATNVINWDDVSNNFQLFGNIIPTGVNDFEVYKNQLFAATSYTSPDIQLVKKLQANTWITDTLIFYYQSQGNTCNSLLAYDDSLMAGGLFYTSVNQKDVRSCMTIRPKPPVFIGANWFTVDNAINKLVMFKNQVIAGGAFKHGNISGRYTPMKSITRKSLCQVPLPLYYITTNINKSVSFKDTSQYAPVDSIRWVFGDGDASTTYQPYNYTTHVYKVPGNYIACAYAYHDCEADETCWPILLPTGINDLDNGDIKIYPNPTTDYLVVEAAPYGTKATLLNLTGQQLGSWTITQAQQQISTSSIVPGTYLLQLTGQDGQKKLVRLVKE